MKIDPETEISKIIDDPEILLKFFHFVIDNAFSY